MTPEIKKYGSTMVIEDNIFRYDEERQINLIDGVPVISSFNFTDSTRQTDSMETGDPDEMFVSTGLTESNEPTDSDEIYFESTSKTAVQEQSDPDEIFCSSTVITKAIESSDPDELNSY